jgi:proline dehydrogenase
MSLLRRLLLSASTNAWLRDRATKTPFVMRSVSRFMPGEQLEDALAAAARLQAAGIGAILTHLGENLTSAGDAENVTRHYLHALDRIHAGRLHAHISVKPTQLGLDFDPAFCHRNLLRLIDRAAGYGNFIWIDMESVPYVDATLALFRQVRAQSPLVGVALQAYLFRTERDLDGLLPLGAALRLVKGAYLESPRVAFSKKRDVDANFCRLACRILDEHERPGSLLHLATHDATLIDRLIQYIDGRHVPASAHEFAMLYGIQEPLQHRLVAAQRPVRVLISYGEHWFPWYMRRLAERPANILFVIKNLIPGSGGAGGAGGPSTHQPYPPEGGRE